MKKYLLGIQDTNVNIDSLDLDGDGKDEYLIFTRSLQDDSLQILLFNQLSEENYEL